MPDSTGFGDYTESGQVIPVTFEGRKGGYTHCMFLNDHPPIAGGRELWGFPEEAGQAEPEGRDRHVGRHAGLRPGSGSPSARWATSTSRPISTAVKASLRGAELPAEDHPACRRDAAHLRDRRILPERHRPEGRLDRAGGAEPFPARLGAGRRTAGAGGGFRRPHPRRPDARSRQGRARLSGLTCPCGNNQRAAPPDAARRLTYCQNGGFSRLLRLCHVEGEIGAMAHIRLIVTISGP